MTRRAMTPGVPVTVGDISVTTWPVNHAQAASGFVLWRDGGAQNLAYTGDTGVCDDWWRYCDSLPFALKHLITEASFPSDLEALAAVSKHLTPKLLRAELAKLRSKPDIHIYHMKAPFAPQIQEELRHELADHTYRLLREKECLDL